MADFASLEVSDGEVPLAGLRFVTLHSPALGRRGDFTFYEAGDVREGAPVIVLMHGVYGSCWSWALQGRAHLALQEAVDAGAMPPSVLVMPSDGLMGLGSGYLPLPDADYEAWIMRDVLDCVRGIFPAASGSLYLAGLSMGGYGALRLGAKYADRVAGIAAHSSVTSLADLETFLKGLPHGHEAAGVDEADVMHWAKRTGDAMPPLRMDCGVADDLLESNRTLAAQLRAGGVTLDYAEFPGGHEWPYWAEHVRETFAFFGALERA